MHYPFLIDNTNDLSKYSYSATGGKSKGILLPSCEKELSEAIKWLKSYNEKYFILGAGSNSIISDQFYDGYVMSLKNLTKVIVDKNNLIIHAQAGAINEHIVQIAYENKLSGLEWMFGLPGQIGATTRMNARCYGSQISNHVVSIRTINTDAKMQVYPKTVSKSYHDLLYGYKNTYFMKSDEIIFDVSMAVIELSCSQIASSLAKMNSNKNDRISKNQFIYPSCGCVFKNDYRPEVSVSSGFLIDCAGLKGYKLSNAQISADHGNFIYNIKSCSEDIIKLSLIMRQKVYEMFGVWLEYEMEMLGAFSDELIKQVKSCREFKPNADQKSRLAEARSEFNKLLSN